MSKPLFEAKETTREEHVAALRERIEREEQIVAHGLEVAKEYVAAHEGRPFIILDQQHGTTSRVLCRCCGATVIQAVESVDPLYTKQINGKLVAYKTITQAITPNYAQFRLVFDDGSAHVGQCCQACLPSILANKVPLDRLYADDVAQWMSERGGSRLAAQYAHRRPIAVLREDLV